MLARQNRTFLPTTRFLYIISDYHLLYCCYYHRHHKYHHHRHFERKKSFAFTVPSEINWDKAVFRKSMDAYPAAVYIITMTDVGDDSSYSSARRRPNSVRQNTTVDIGSPRVTKRVVPALNNEQRERQNQRK